MVSTCEEFLLYFEVIWLSRGKALVWLFELWAELTALFMVQGLWKTTDKLRLFKNGYLAASFWKMNKVRLSLQRKQLTEFGVNDKIWFQVKIRILENFRWTTVSLTLWGFLMRLVALFTYLIIWYFNEMCKISKLFITQWTHISQMIEP